MSSEVTIQLEVSPEVTIQLEVSSEVTIQLQNCLDSDNWGKIICRPDEREEAKHFYNYAVSIYKTHEQEELLVGHVPIRSSFLFGSFIEKDGKKIDVEVRGGSNDLLIITRYPTDVNFLCQPKKKLWHCLGP